MSKSKTYPYLRGVLFSALLLLASYGNSIAQLTVDGSQTPQELVDDVLIGGGVTVSNISYTGDPIAIGFFDGSNSNIGLNSGVLLTTGDINLAPGPNLSDSEGNDNNESGYADLDPIANAQTHDAAVLEFDFVPIADSVTFRYVFGSEEYPEFVNGGFNDAFGFFISGPGITGTQNIALIPGSSQFVTIDNVNNVTNSQYYVSNAGGTTVQYDGFTTVLTARAEVVPCETYHITLAIADAGDGVYDSGVFLEANSFSSGTVNISAEATFSTSSNDTALVEGCGEAYIHFERTGDVNNAQVVPFTISGSATNGTDYTQIPDSVIIPAGQSSTTLTLEPLSDGSNEGAETVTITLQLAGLCNGQPQPTVTVTISDPPPLTVNASGDTSLTCPGTVPITAVASGGMGGYQYTWDNNAGTGSTVMVNPNVTTVYTVTATDTCGTQTVTDQVTIDIPDYQPMELTAEDVVVCNGDSAEVAVEVSGGLPDYTYTWDSGLGNGPSHWVNPDSSATYMVVVTDSCNVSDSAQVIATVQQANADFTYEYTGNKSFQFTNLTPNVISSDWTFGDGFGVSDLTHPEYTYEDSGTYIVTLFITNSDGCTDSAQHPVIAYPEFKIYIPNAFTPGGNDLNDYFFPKGEGYVETTMKIFDRWGKMIYRSYGRRNTWNGRTESGREAPYGVYAYVLEFKTPVGEYIVRRGHLTLIR